MEPKKVFVGLDLGTESCGWAVTDQNYNVLKKSGKHLHGVRKFTEAEAAENRRIKRSGRRRLERRKFRINILQDLFNEEIIKKDPNFFIRLNNSFFNLKEKPKELGKYSLFNDKLYTDAQYYKEYKTIFHLRHHLMNSNEKEDIRLIYLACHNILKYRGNFLMKGISPDKKSSDFSYIIEQIQNLNIKLNDFLDDEIYSISVNEKKIEAILDVIKKTNSINDRVNKINKILNKQNDKQNKKIIELFIGKKVQFKDILLDDKYKDIDVPKIKFSEEKYEDDVEPILYELIGDAADAIHTAKKIYNWIMIKNFLKESNFISEAKVIEYNNHHRDLLDFKKFIRNNFDKEIYNDMFRKSEKQANNYVAYVKTNFVNNKKHYVSGCSYEDFLKTTKKLLKSFEERNNIDNKTQNKPSNLNEINWNLYIKIKERVENREFMPKQRVSTNGVLPYQLHLYELNTILDNASKHYKFLNRTDESGLTIKDKIEQLMTFRIPYYIGPLNDAHKDDPDSGFAWIKRREKGRVLPWNYNKKVDENKSAENFITRMTRKCSYLKGKDVLPKNSLLYSEFRVLNELNNLQINGEKISVDLKEKIINGLFKNYKKVTQKGLLKYLNKEGLFSQLDEISISGIDGDFKNSLASYIDFSKIFEDINDNYNMIEDIIFVLTIFEDKEMAINRIRKNYPNLNRDIISSIKKLNYTGWGNLSEEFLEKELYIVDDLGQRISVMHLLRNENLNLQTALYDIRYNLIKKVDEINGFENKNKNLSYDDLMDEVYVSPGIKRSLWQSIKLVDEIKKIVKQPIDKFFVEVARGGGVKGRRTTSRKDRILKLYKIANKEKDSINQLKEKLNHYDENRLRGDKLFFYFLQLGRCMYTNEPIDLDKLETSAYDIDHIIPRAYLKDDSVTNRVLVKRNANAAKTDNYPLDIETRTRMKGYWEKLKSIGLLSDEKFKRLTRSNTLTDKDKGDFINRQLVYTNQATKALANILEQTNLDSTIVYSKAGNVSDFRHDFNLLKSREVNDFHHAHDAYLNIVVGNAYRTKFGENAIYFFRKNKDRSTFVNTKKMFFRDVKGAWNSDGTSIKTVKNTLLLKDVLVTKMVTERKDAFYDETIYPKETKDLFPLKSNDSRYKDTAKYGGYKSLKIAYFMIVEHIKSKKKIISIEGIPVYYSYKINNKEITVEDVLINYLNLRKPKVLVEKIKVGTLMKINNTYANLAGISGENIKIHNANQLYLNQKYIDYFRLIEKHSNRYEKVDELKDYDSDMYEISIAKQDGKANPTLTKKMNLAFYDELVSKFRMGLYDGLPINGYTDDLIKARINFNKLNVRQQAHSLLEFIKIIKCNAQTGNLSLFMERASNKGSNLISKNISERKIIFYDESITGLYRKVRWQNK